MSRINTSHLISLGVTRATQLEEKSSIKSERDTSSQNTPKCFAGQHSVWVHFAGAPVHFCTGALHKCASVFWPVSGFST